MKTLVLLVTAVLLGNACIAQGRGIQDRADSSIGSSAPKKALSSFRTCEPGERLLHSRSSGKGEDTSIVYRATYARLFRKPYSVRSGGEVLRCGFWDQVENPLVMSASLQIDTDKPYGREVQKEDSSHRGDFKLSAEAMNNGDGPNSNGIARALTACHTVACVVEISTSYPFDAERGFLPIAMGQQLLDYRGGGNTAIVNDPQPATRYMDPSYFTRVCLTHYATASHCLSVSQENSGSGYNNGDIGKGVHTNQEAYWTIDDGLKLKVRTQGKGISGGYGLDMMRSGQGDTNNYWYCGTHGGYRAPSDEGHQCYASHTFEARTYFSGTILSRSGDLVVASASPTGSSEDLGVGQRLVEMSQNAVISAGAVMSAARLTDLAGNNSYEVLQVSGKVPPSRYMLTLDVPLLDVPTIPSAGNNAVCTNRTFAATHFQGEGVPVPGDVIVLPPQPFMEATTVISVTSVSRHHYLITACMMYVHNTAGVFIVHSPFGIGALEFTANTNNGLRHNVDVMGATDSTHILAVQGKQGNITAFQFGLVDRTQLSPVGPVTVSDHGIATIPLSPESLLQHPAFQRTSVVTLSGFRPLSLNTQCTNVRGAAFQNNSARVECDIKGNDSVLSVQNGTISLGTTGYGNSTYVLRPAAEVLDIQTYPTAGSPSVGDERHSNFHLRLGPNVMPLRVGGTIAEDHDLQMRIVSQNHFLTVYNPYTVDSDLRASGVEGPGINRDYHADHVTNQESIQSYAGGGSNGTQSTPSGYTLDGPWANGLGMQYAPFPAGNPVIRIGCPWFGCDDPIYITPVIEMAGNQGSGTLAWIQRSSTWSLGGSLLDARYVPAVFKSLSSLGVVSGASFIERLYTPAASSTHCDQGQFADDANYHYVCVAANTWKRVALSSF